MDDDQDPHIYRKFYDKNEPPRSKLSRAIPRIVALIVWLAVIFSFLFRELVGDGEADLKRIAIAVIFGAIGAGAIGRSLYRLLMQ